MTWLLYALVGLLLLIVAGLPWIIEALRVRRAEAVTGRELADAMEHELFGAEEGNQSFRGRG